MKPCALGGLGFFFIAIAVWQCFGDSAEVSPARPQVAPGFSFAALRERVRAMAAQPYHAEAAPVLPDSLKGLSFDQYQSLRFRPEQGPWHGQAMRFSLQFLHRGYLFQDSVRVYLVDAGQVQDFRFSPEQFDYSQLHLTKPVTGDLQFAGLRVLYPLNVPGKQDEVASFIGATYFRLIGAGQRYGASGRGLAIDTAEPTGEEFPRFTEFWIEKPAPQATQLQLFALLDSPSAAGVYRFVVKPGERSDLEVEASVFLRKRVQKLGLAPLTSMFLKGANWTQYIADYRPQAHDSDGLLLEGGPGQWSWRPLINPDKDHHVSQFPFEQLAGFGLLQRDRNFHDYEDLIARFELRPSLWVQPLESWGAGRVELVEIPSSSDGNDNIVAYWLPKQIPDPGKELHWTYRLSATTSEPEKPSLLRVQSTLIGMPHDHAPLRFVLDFAEPAPIALASQAPLEANVQTSNGQIRNLMVQTNQAAGGYRASFELSGAPGQPADLRLYLHSAEKVLSETWLYHLQSL
jgi:glucans biosynthesis protein